MSDLIDTTEMYLKTIFEMEEDGVAPLRARIVDRLGHSGPTVSQTVARMERDGLLKVGRDRQLQLTDKGRELATDVVRKHRLAERLLLDVIGLDLPQVHDEACRWEHVMSDEVQARLWSVLRSPDLDPFGNPIPEQGEADQISQAPGDAIEDLEIPEAGLPCVVRRIGEPVQAEADLLDELLKAGVRPGVHVTLINENGVRVLVAPRGKVAINDLISRHLFVE
ncbi:hypothetical protein BSR29_04995 [Boudabousia liubingyangii]|uniref:HTH dtxR-type domain-containing protein n=1 Tax=Boudabousia liubingyangii TaxID=1921764 RepID=A0A1Q5PLC2_9ACTO|nr:metal-dependent transcriptional regulator [Boudabousia liubingyangii]OKL47851.1 hypothetical protein BSR29_04995 [Boudabousia liubingyangii]